MSIKYFCFYTQFSVKPQFKKRCFKLFATQLALFGRKRAIKRRIMIKKDHN